MKISPQSPCQKIIKGPLFQAMHNNSFMCLGIHSALIFCRVCINPAPVNPLVYSTLAELLEAGLCTKLEAGSSESSIWTK